MGPCIRTGGLLLSVVWGYRSEREGRECGQLGKGEEVEEVLLGLWGQEVSQGQVAGECVLLLTMEICLWHVCTTACQKSPF